MTSSTQAEFHKRKVIWNLLHRNGPEQGVAPAVIKHAYAWWTTGTDETLPKKWQGQIESLFNQIIPPAEMQRVDSVIADYLAGDDAGLRPLIRERVCVEIGISTKDMGYAPSAQWRSRKFSDPLFITPSGFLNAYPEVDEDLFLDYDQAQAAVAFYRNTPAGQSLGTNASYRIETPVELGKIGGAGFKRWQKEVKGQAYTEPRRSLEEVYSIYASGGREALKALYSPSYTFVLLRKFKLQGWNLKPADIA